MSGQSKRELADRLRLWYKGGRRGMLKVCETEGAPQPVIDAVVNWYEKGGQRIEILLELIEKDAAEDDED